MVLAYHLILSAYGFWMPNEACGSWSAFVRSYELWLAGGDATKVHTRRSVAHQRRDRGHEARLRAALKRSPVRFSPDQCNAIAAGFADYCSRTGCVLHACAILRDHAHLVVARHRITIEKTCDQLKAAATAELRRRGLHPFTDDPLSSGRLPSPWARNGWWVYLDTPDDITRSIDYTNHNPTKAGLRLTHGDPDDGLQARRVGTKEVAPPQRPRTNRRPDRRPPLHRRSQTTRRLIKDSSTTFDNTSIPIT